MIFKGLSSNRIKQFFFEGESPTLRAPFLKNTSAHSFHPLTLEGSNLTQIFITNFLVVLQMVKGFMKNRNRSRLSEGQFSLKSRQIT